MSWEAEYRSVLQCLLSEQAKRDKAEKELSEALNRIREMEEKERALIGTGLYDELCDLRMKMRLK